MSAPCPESAYVAGGWLADIRLRDRPRRAKPVRPIIRILACQERVRAEACQFVKRRAASTTRVTIAHRLVRVTRQRDSGQFATGQRWPPNGC